MNFEEKNKYDNEFLNKQQEIYKKYEAISRDSEQKHFDLKNQLELIDLHLSIMRDQREIELINLKNGYYDRFKNPIIINIV